MGMQFAKPRITLDAQAQSTSLALQEYSCASMEHRRQGSKVDHVVMGCKQKLACEQDEAQNYSSNMNKGKQQCWNTDPRKVSKCRACCETDGCNQAVIDAGPTNSFSWA